MKAMKKSILTFLAFALVFTMAMPAFAANVATGAQYSDIENADVADAVKVLSSLDVLQGYPDGTFKPDNTITRAEFAAVVVRLLGFEKAAQAAVGKTQFKDEVLPWASGYVNVAVQQNLLTGYPDGTFRANQPVTQAEALTILVRALGYKPMAEAQGQWPFNYIVIANQVGLISDLSVVANQPATRGFVASASKEALTIPKAIAAGFNMNGEVNYVVSGTQNTKEQTILGNNLGFASKKEVVTDIPRVNDNLKSNQIKLADTGIVTVPEGFDFEAAFGTELKVYLDDKAVVYAKAGDAKFDAVKEKDGKLTLVDEDAKYEFDKDATIYVDGKKVAVKDLQGKSFAYAKVVVNKDNKVRFVDAFNLNSHIVVEKSEDNIVSGYGYEQKVKDFTLVKEGKTIALADIATDDIFFYNAKAKYGEVYTKAVEGELEKVYTSTFKLGGKTYKIGSAQYIKNDELAAVDSTVLDNMKKQGAVKVYTNRLGDVVLVTGDTGEAKTANYYAYLLKNSAKLLDRGEIAWSLDVLNPSAEVKKYNVSNKYVTETYGDAKWNTNPLDANDVITTGDMLKGALLKITVKDDQTFKAVEKLNAKTVDVSVTNPLKVDAKYVGKYQLQNSAVVYWTEEGTTADKIKAMTWEQAADEFSKVTAVEVFADSKDKVVAMIISKTDADLDAKSYTGLLVDKAQISSNDKWEATIFVDGTEEIYVTEKNLSTFAEGIVVDFKVGNKSGEITSIAEADRKVVGDITANPISSPKTIEVAGSDYELVQDSYIFDKDLDLIAFNDLNKGDSVKVYTVVKDSRFAKYVIVTKVADEPGQGEVEVDGTVTFVDWTVGEEKIEIATAKSSKLYNVTGFARIFVADLADNTSNLLSGAKVKAVVDGDNLVGFEYIKLTANSTTVDFDIPAAFAGLTIEGAGTVAPDITVLNDINVFADNVTLKNLKANTVTVAAGVENFDASNADITNLVLLGGGSNSVHLTNTTVATLDVNAAVRVVLSQATVTTMNVTVDGPVVEADANTVITTLDAKSKVVTIKGDVKIETVTNAGNLKNEANLVAIKGAFTPTGSVGYNSTLGNTYVELELKVNGVKVSLDDASVSSIKQDGVALTPNTDTTLWFNIMKPAASYTFEVVSKDGLQKYEATLEWPALNAAEVNKQAYGAITDVTSLIDLVIKVSTVNENEANAAVNALFNNNNLVEGVTQDTIDAAQVKVNVLPEATAKRVELQQKIDNAQDLLTPAPTAP